MTRERGERGELVGIEGKGFERLGVLPVSCWRHITLVFVKVFFFFKKRESENEWGMQYVQGVNELRRKKEWRETEMKKRLQKFLLLLFFYYYYFFYCGTTQLANEPHRDAAPLPTFVEVRSVQIEWPYYVLFSVTVKSSLCTPYRNRGSGGVAPLTL